MDQKSGPIKERTEVQLTLMKLDHVAVTKIACSETHSAVCTNTGAVFCWGSNDTG